MRIAEENINRLFVIKIHENEIKQIKFRRQVKEEW